MDYNRKSVVLQESQSFSLSAEEWEIVLDRLQQEATSSPRQLAVRLVGSFIYGLAMALSLTEGHPQLSNLVTCYGRLLNWAVRHRSILVPVAVDMLSQVSQNRSQFATARNVKETRR